MSPTLSLVLWCCHHTSITRAHWYAGGIECYALRGISRTYCDHLLLSLSCIVPINLIVYRV